MYAFIATREANLGKKPEAERWAKRLADHVNQKLEAAGIEFVRPMTVWTVHIGERGEVWWTAVAKDVATLEKW